MILKKGEKIIRTNLDEKLDGKIVFRFVTIETRLQKDVNILNSWIKDFEKFKVPFIITEFNVRKNNKKTLWKEDFSVPISGVKKGKKPIYQRYKKDETKT